MRARPGLVGSTSVAADVAGQVFDTDLDIVWPTARRYAHVPAGEPVPDVAGQAVIRHLARGLALRDTIDRSAVAGST